MTHRRSVTIAAPAKINLGLEIPGKRDDGFHEIRTVMAMIDLADTVTVSTRSVDTAVHIDGVPGVRAEDNLIGKAIRVFADESGTRTGYDVVVEKAIPSPGGLGGASSDAAAALLALNALHEAPLSQDDLLRLASGLGSDVPFFLGSPVALASGTGTTLQPLPTLEAWIVLVVPTLELAAKTQTLYRALREEDFSNGQRVSSVADRIARGQLPHPRHLHNAFTRPLYELAPDLKTVSESTLAAGAPFVALSGAGPAHYVLYESKADAEALACRLKTLVPQGTIVACIRLLDNRPPVSVLDG